MNQNQKNKQVRLVMDKDTAKGNYSNQAIVASTSNEFFIDFLLAYPGQAPMHVQRTLMSPQHAKALMISLQDNVRRHENQHGPIALPTAKRDPSEQN